MECNECKRKYRRNYWNAYQFSLDLYQREPYPHSHLEFEVTSFFASNKGDKCESTFSLYLDKGCGKNDGFGDGEKILCEEIPIDQLKRLYHFLDTVLWSEDK